MAEQMIEREEHVDGFKVGPPPLRVVEEVKAVPECILHDGVARIRLEHEIHRYGLARDARLLHPTQHFVRVLADRGLYFPNAGDGEKGVQGPAPLAMHVVVEGTRHGFRSCMMA